MSLPFARSTRALYVDHKQPAQAILILALILLGLWAIWFCWAPLTLYETGQIVSTTRRDTLIAAVPAQAQARVQPGQLALLRPQGDLAKQVKAIPAMVMEVKDKVVNGQFQIELAPLWDQEPLTSLPKDFKGQVDIQVEKISPAQLIWRAASQGNDAQAIMLNPQTP